MSCSSEGRAPHSLDDLCGSPEYVFGLASMGTRLSRAERAPELIAALWEATQRLGVDASYFASSVREDAEFNSFRFLVACDPVWSQSYLGMDCVSADAWLRYATDHTEPALSTEVAPKDEREQRTIELATSYGFNSAFIVPAVVTGTRVGVLVLGSRSPNFFDGEGRATLAFLARGLALQLHEKVSAMVRRELRSRWELTTHELELLAFERKGTPTKVIASLLGCSIGAIDQRFHRLNGKLGVSKRRQAARLAAVYGLI